MEMGTEILENRVEVCETHGEFESRNFFGKRWSKCPVCADELSKKEEAARVAAEAEKQAERWQYRIDSAGIPARFQGRTLQSFVADTSAKKKALEFATAFADGFDEVVQTGRSAVFLGLPGTGKTHLACGIGLQLIRNNRSVLFTSVLRAIRRIKETWSKAADETETEAVHALVRPHLLILDEVGVQFGSETEKMILFDVLNERYEHRRPTILISNLTLPEVKAYLGERVFDRLREDGGEVVTFDWPSHRGKS